MLTLPFLLLLVLIALAFLALAWVTLCLVALGERVVQQDAVLSVAIIALHEAGLLTQLERED